MENNGKSKKHGWHPEDIKSAVRKRGKTLRALALDNGLHYSSTSCALIRPLPGAEMVIAKFIGRPLHEIWPQRWKRDGSRVRAARKGSKNTASTQG